MGLDNGIIIKNLTQRHINQIPSAVRFQNFRNGRVVADEENDLCYWRKCYSIRNEVNKILGMTFNEYHAKVTVESIPKIIQVLKNHLNYKYWRDHADMIWSYDEIQDSLNQQIVNLEWLEGFMRENPEVEAEWYDSY